LLLGRFVYFYCQYAFFFMLTYLALGDSYTIGEQVPFERNFPNQLVALLRTSGVECADPVIIAQTGWTTDELMAAISEKNIMGTFSFVTLLIGVNNQYRGRTLENYKEELHSLLHQAIAFARGNSKNVVVLSIPDWGVTPFAEGRDRNQIAVEIDNFNKVNRFYAVDHDCSYIEITQSTRDNGQVEGFLAIDALHPSELEYAVWAKQAFVMVSEHFGTGSNH